MLHVRERHWLLHNSIGALPSEVIAIFWVHLFPIIAFFTLLILSILNGILFYLYNQRFHPFSAILKDNKNDFEMTVFKIHEY